MVAPGAPTSLRKRKGTASYSCRSFLFRPTGSRCQVVGTCWGHNVRHGEGSELRYSYPKGKTEARKRAGQLLEEDHYVEDAIKTMKSYCCVPCVRRIYVLLSAYYPSFLGIRPSYILPARTSFPFLVFAYYPLLAYLLLPIEGS